MKRFAAGALALTLLLSGCTAPAEPTPTVAVLPTANSDVAESTIFAMDTVMTLRVYGENGEEMVSLISKEINTMENILSVTREGSDVWRIDHSDGAAVEVDDYTKSLLELAQTLGKRTDGALDVTMYPVVKAWGFTTSEYRIPADSELTALMERVGYDKISLKGNKVTMPAEMEMDLGSIAKGYAGEVAADLLRENGVTSALLNMGGNVQTVGSKTDGTAWRIGIQDPNEPTGSYLGVLQLVDQAAVTSGGYQRYFEEEGVRYWHIMDPATGSPARSGLISVTIVGDKGGMCDGLSTSLFVMGLEGAVADWRANRDYEAILVDEDNNVWITEGLKDSFALVEGSEYTLHIVEGQE